MSLILLPNLISDDSDIDLYLPKKLKEIILSLDGIICESEKNLRRFILKIISREDFQKLNIKILNEHSDKTDLYELLDLIKDQKWGLISDAGLVCIADPGSSLVRLAKNKEIDVTALSGPSSIFLALMLSGLNSQRFSFFGYLPRDEKVISTIKALERESLQKKQTQVFIEAPYRSDKMLEILLNTLNKNTYLSIAINLTALDEKVITKKVINFKNNKIHIGKKPCVFLFEA